MSGIYEWIRNIACYLCIFNLILHVVPGKTYKKYVRFIGGILLILLVMAPLADVMKLTETFDSALRQEEIKGELSDLQAQKEGLEELKEEKVQEAFLNEIKRQIEQIVKAYGFYPVETEVVLQEAEEGLEGIQKISLKISKKRAGSDIYIGEIGEEAKKEPVEVEKMKNEIESVYQVPASHIDVVIRE